jgi:hypothetical protein
MLLQLMLLLLLQLVCLDVRGAGTLRLNVAGVIWLFDSHL